MRLFNIETLKLESFDEGYTIPPYVILSIDGRRRRFCTRISNSCLTARKSKIYAATPKI
jgi:hypothetical protein